MKKLIILIVVTSGLLLTSCYQEPERGIAKITTTYMDFLQPGVDVHLFGPAGSNIDHHFTSNQAGEVIYEHDPALEVILEVHCTWTDPSTSIFHQTNGIIRITPNEVANETFDLP